MRCVPNESVGSQAKRTGWCWPATADAFVRLMATQFGPRLRVERLKPGAYEAMDPIAEAQAMVGKDRVVVVDPGEPR